MAELGPVVFVGPTPPPIGGATRTFEELLAGAGELGVDVRLVDTSPGSVPAALEARYREVAAARLTRLAAANRVQRRPVVWCASIGMLVRLSRFVPLLARSAPVAIVSFGGQLGEVLHEADPRRRAQLLARLGAARRIWVEAELTAAEARAAGLTNVAVLGPTRGAWGVAPRLEVVPVGGRPLRLAYAGRIYDEKGLDDLAALTVLAGGALEVDLLGPVEPGHEHAVEAVLRAHPRLHHHGTAAPAEVLARLRAADASAVLSRYAGEGHPGTVIESLLVGTPAIVSDHRALPELVEDGTSGLVVPAAEGGGWDVEGLWRRLAALDDEAWAALRTAAHASSARFAPAGQVARILADLTAAPGRAASGGTVDAMALGEDTVAGGADDDLAAAEQPTLLYVMGRGHSGSTLLDSVLASAGAVEGVGELVAGMGRLDKRCACGATIGDCPFWSEVRRRSEAATGRDWATLVQVSAGQAMVKRFLHELRARPGSAEVAEARAAITAPVRAIAELAGVQAVVDSSKEPTRALFLSRFVAGTHLVHLVRDPVDVAASDIHRARNGTFRFQRRQLPTGGRELPFLLISSVGWLVGNALCELAARRGDAPVVRVRYEDLCADPAAVLGRVGALAGIEVTDGQTRLSGGEPVEFGHKIGGNAIRVAGPVAVDDPTRHRRPIRARQAALVRAVTWPLRRRYGY